MATYFTSEPDTLNLARFIVRVPVALLPNGPAPSAVRGNSGAIEAQDVFGMPNGETRSKHYSNRRLKDWSYIGATGSGVGIWVVRDNNEGNSGGPFYRSLVNQGTATDQEITYIINYGEAQTEAFRPGILNSYTLVFNDGNAPDVVDTAWMARMGLLGYVAPSARGGVVGVGITGRDPAYRYTVGFSNATAQYWTDAAPGDGHFQSAGMIPGAYTMRIYKNELAVDTRSVIVQADQTTAVDSIAIQGDPSASPAIWRIGDWDGSPAEFLNGDKVTVMHPSDVRMQPWNTADYIVGRSTPATAFPAYQWKDVNGRLTVRFSLRSDQISDLTLRIGITTAYENGRPTVKLNNWSAPIPSPSVQPSTRTLTIGSYRGNNTMFSFAIPASSLVVGENVLSLGVASGSGSTAYLSAGIAYDAIDLLPH
jgi:rhamnogalacturonan endolyase